MGLVPNPVAHPAPVTALCGMRTTSSSPSTEVVPGLYIKPQPNSSNLQAYCRVKRQTFRKSMGTSDAKEASRRALEWYHELKKDTEHGRSSKQVGWSLLRDGYLASLPKGAKHDYHAATIARHFEPFFGRLMDVRAINASRISDYLVYRNTSTVRPPLPQTLKPGKHCASTAPEVCKHKGVDRCCSPSPEPIGPIDESGGDDTSRKPSTGY